MPIRTTCNSSTQLRPTLWSGCVIECEVIVKRVGCLLDKTKKKRNNRRIVFNEEKVVHYYRATIYFGELPSPYSTQSDHYQLLPTSLAGMGEERVDPGAMHRVNDSHLIIPDTKRGYESGLPFGRVGIWNLARAVAQARAVYLRFLLLLSDCIGDECQYAHVMSQPALQHALREANLMKGIATLFFYIDSISSIIFICDKLTIRHTGRAMEILIQYKARVRSLRSLAAPRGMVFS